MAKKRGSFRERVLANAHKQKTRGAQYGYLSLPQGVRVFKEEPSTTVLLDFLPYEVTDENHPDRDDETGEAAVESLWYKRPYKVHRNVGVSNEALVCPTSIAKPCPICEERQRQFKKGDADKDTLRAMTPSRRNLYVVVPRDVTKYEEEPHIWDISQFAFQDMLNEELEEKDEFGGFPDPDEGYTVKVRFGEDQIGTNKFAKTSRIDFKDREKKITDEVLDKVPNLDEVITVLPYERVRAKFFEMDSATETETGPGEKETETEVERPRREERRERRREAREREPEDEGGKKDEKEERRSREREEPREERRRPVEREERKEAKGGNGKAADDDCPYEHRFGIDTDKFKDCDRCEVWNACTDQKERLAKRA